MVYIGQKLYDIHIHNTLLLTVKVFCIVKMTIWAKLFIAKTNYNILNPNNKKKVAYYLANK